MYAAKASMVVLTDRETEVLQLVAEGASAKEVALSLTMAPRTVEKHLDHIRLKMRARNRVHMVAMAMTDGLLLRALN